MPKERPGPPGGKRDVNRRERTRAIGEAALALFLERGIEAVTIDDITRAASIAKGSFYRYFDDKTALVTTLVAPLADPMREALTRCERALECADTREALLGAYQALAQDLVPITVGNVDVARLYLQENRAPGDGARAPIRALSRDIEEGAIRLTRIATARGLLGVDTPEVSALAVVGAVEQLTLATLGGRLAVPPLRAATTLIALVLEGLQVRR